MRARGSTAPLALVALASLALAGLGFAGSAVAKGVTDGLQSAWIEMGPKDALIARAITEASDCPVVKVDGERDPMIERAAASPPDYPVLTCQRNVPRDSGEIVVGGRDLQPLETPVSRIAVVGDTGCRLAGPGRSQSCNDPDEWPFEQVADSIAEWDPQLILHTGDYHYREQACPDGNQGCQGSPFGYNWPAWDADLFTPAAKALRTAPWIFIRGNHEICSRAGEGWFRFLDPRRPRECQDVTAPYVVGTGAGLRMLVMDTSNASDFEPYNPQPYVPQYAALPSLAGKKAWLLEHHPLWGLVSIAGGTKTAVDNISLEMASNNTLPSAVRMVMSGHLHNAEVLGYTGNRAPQLVAGNGGTQLDAQITAPLEGTEVAGETVTDGYANSEFGFFTFTPEGPGWQLTIRDVDGAPIARCQIASKSAPCAVG